MRLAESGDYIPSALALAELERLGGDILEFLGVVAITGPTKPLKEFRECEEDFEEEDSPLAFMMSQPFKDMFGPTWSLASAQNKKRAPRPRAREN